MNSLRTTALAILAAAFLWAGCEGTAGVKGEPGPQGDAGATGAAGAPGAKGDKGDKGDNGDPGQAGTAGAAGAQGAKGDPGVQGPAGATGTTGEKGAAGEKGATGDKGDPGAAGAKGDPGAAGAKGDKGDPGQSVGTLRVVVVDQHTNAPIAKAAIAGKLGSTLKGVTDAKGTWEATVPTGVYQVAASAPQLFVGATAVNPTTPWASADSDGISVTAGGTATLKVAIKRLNLALVNLTKVHTAGTQIYNDDQCKACHSDMQGFGTTNAAMPAFHAIKTHGSLSCTMCHAKTEVNLGNWGIQAGAFARKQVDVTKTCASCHKQYPAKFP